MLVDNRQRVFGPNIGEDYLVANGAGRHPMYAGYIIPHIGFLLAYPTLWNLAVYSGALVAQVARILREERILNGQPLYRQFSSLVRYRLLPGVF